MSKKNTVDPELERAVSTMLRQVMRDERIDLDSKLKVVDRAMKLEALKAKIKDDVWGSAFDEATEEN